MTPTTSDRFRRLALSLPDATEGAHHDHPDFRANGSIFATLLPDGERGMVRLPPSEQRRLLAVHADAFEFVDNAWGRQGCTLVRLAAVDADVLREALTLAWQASLDRAATARSKPAKAKRSSATSSPTAKRRKR